MNHRIVIASLLGFACSHPAAAPDGGADPDGARPIDAASAGDAGGSLPAPAITREAFAIGINHLGSGQPMPNDLIAQGPTAARIWDTSYPAATLQWPGINQCAAGGCAANPSLSSFDFSHLDDYLATLHSAGYTDALYTISRTPPWASQRGSRCVGPGNPDATCTGAADTDCDYASGPANLGRGAGQCETNVDLRADGSGSNATWRNWVYHLVAHVRGLDGNHAHVAYYEIWNEPYRSDTLWNSPECVTNGESCAFRGTWAQLLRMIQDARCIIEGHADDPITALGKTCATDATLPAIGLDPTAQIVSPSAGTSQPRNRALLANLFYCNGTGALKPASDCTWSLADPLGANAVDVLNTHGYYYGVPPEGTAANLATLRTTLQPSELAKPMFVDEGNGEWVAKPYDPELQQASVPRYFLSLWNQSSSRTYWDNAGAPLWLANGDPGCSASAGCLTKGGAGYATTIGWLVGKAVFPVCAVSGSVWQCNLVSTDPGYRGLVVWDVGACQTASGCDSTKSFVGCTFATDCTSSAFALPTTTTWASWRDLDTDTAHTVTDSSVAIGIKPILIEGRAP